MLYLFIQQALPQNGPFVQKDFQHEFLAGLGLTRLISSSEEKQDYDAENSRATLDINPGLPAMEQRLRQVQASRSFSEQLSMQPLRVSTDACRSCKTFKEGYALFSGFCLSDTAV